MIEIENGTVWGDDISAQLRGDDIALHMRDSVEISGEAGEPYILHKDDVMRLKALLELYPMY